MGIGMSETAATEPQQSIDGVRLRLADILGDLRLLPLAQEPRERARALRAVQSSLDAVRDELDLVIHMGLAEEDGLSARLDDIDRRLAEGWVPDASPVEDVLARLRPHAKR